MIFDTKISFAYLYLYGMWESYTLFHLKFHQIGRFYYLVNLCQYCSEKGAQEMYLTT